MPSASLVRVIRRTGWPFQVTATFWSTSSVTRLSASTVTVPTTVGALSGGRSMSLSLPVPMRLTPGLSQ